MEQRPYRFELYRMPDGKFGWRLRGRNGAVVAESGRLYAEKRHCLRGIDLLTEAIDDDATLVDLTKQ